MKMLPSFINCKNIDDFLLSIENHENSDIKDYYMDLNEKDYTEVFNTILSKK